MECTGARRGGGTAAPAPAASSSARAARPRCGGARACRVLPGLLAVPPALTRRRVVVARVGVADGSRTLLRHALVAEPLVLLRVLHRRAMLLAGHLVPPRG